LPTPEDNGTQPAASINPQKDWTLREVIRTRSFWALVAFPFFSLIGIYIVVVHNVRFMVDKGIDPMTAALIFALAGMSSSIFRIFWGWISDHIGREKAYTAGMGCLFGVFPPAHGCLGKKSFHVHFFYLFRGGVGSHSPPFHGDRR
jgi:MFS family permease